jgi:predicted phage-related endonuclease
VIDTYDAFLDIIEIDRHPAAEQRIVQIALTFWDNVRNGARPAPDYGKDGETIARMFPHAEAGTELDLSADNRLAELLPARAMLKNELTGIEAHLEAIDGEIKLKLGANEKATTAEWRLSWKDEQRKAYTVKESTRRVLRIASLKENGI